MRSRQTAASPATCHPERSRSFGEGVSRYAATIRSKTEERKRRRDLVRTLAGFPHDVTFMTKKIARFQARSRASCGRALLLARFTHPQKFDFGFASAQDDRLQVMRRIKQQPSCLSAPLATFLFDTAGAKRKVTKRETPGEHFARCDARGGLRALHLRPLAWGLFPQARCST